MKYEFKSIKFFNADEDIPILNKTICFQGKTLDDRGEKAKELNKNNIIINIKYDSENFSLILNGIQYKVSENGYIEEIKKICSVDNFAVVIDATTLNIVDILFILKALQTHSLIKELQILYIEPKEYSLKNSSISEFDNFTLSSAFKEFPPVPGYTIMTFEKEEKVDLISFLGFEQARLGHIFRADDGATYNTFIPVIPLPGFRPGWENRTLSNHLKFFSPQYKIDKIEYVSANNPYQSYKLLKNLSKTRKTFRIAPIGTKPNSIGCAVFLINNTEINVGLLFDFPEKLEKRSKGIGKINIYTLYKDNNCCN